MDLGRQLVDIDNVARLLVKVEAESSVEDSAFARCNRGCRTCGQSPQSRMAGMIISMAAVRTPRVRPGWVLDEVASGGRENLDAGHVARYDLKEDVGAAEELALLQRLGLTQASLLVDIGAGTGHRQPCPR